MSVEENVRRRLFELQDEEYRAFQSKLIPNIDPAYVIGVRTPQLRAFAQEFSKTIGVGEFLRTLPHTYYEENNLHALLINGMKDYEQTITELDAFLPFVDNWATCDTLRPGVFKKCRPELLEKIKGWIRAEHTYTIRFGLEMLMVHFLDEDFQPEYLSMAASVDSEEYYVRMMAAWYFATALAKQYDATLPYIQGRCLEPWTHNKAIQKAIESYRITVEQKNYLRTLKIK